MDINATQRHQQALLSPKTNEEIALTHLVRGMELYLALLDSDADLTAKQRSHLSAAISAIAAEAPSLLEGPLGRLDALTLRQTFDELAEMARKQAECDERQTLRLVR